MTTLCADTKKEDQLLKEAAKMRVYLRKAASGLKLVQREQEFSFPEGKEYQREIRIDRLFQPVL